MERQPPTYLCPLASRTDRLGFPLLPLKECFGVRLLLAAAALAFHRFLGHELGLGAQRPLRLGGFVFEASVDTNAKTPTQAVAP